MKKFLLFTFLLFFSSQTFAVNPANGLSKIPENFKPECYEYYAKIDKSQVWDISGENYKTYKIKLDKIKDLVFTQFGYILPYKYFSDIKNSYTYENSLGINNDYLLDYNKNTFKELNSNTQNEIILSFEESLEKNNFDFIFDYSTDNFSPEYYISDDNLNWNLIKKQDIQDFSFKYLKINFISKNTKTFLENIKIYELNFPKKSMTVLLNSYFNDNIEIYTNYNCKDKDFSTRVLSHDNFSIDKGTKTIELNIDNNPKYNVYSKKDYDNDWVEDEIDNCKYRYNPDQKDLNGDGIGDLCSDDDKDGKIGYYDNCVYVYNPDQKDINRNGIGDVCEFDKDKDGIFDSQDNCINTSNSDQADDDKDGIGNICDNCEYYNPAQRDTNQNGVGDICEQIEKNLLENDKDGDKVIDSKDNCKDIVNPDQADDDKDGVGNVCDNCKHIQNKDQLDFNKNGVGDICEDSDNDGIDGLTDNCINIANLDQKDTDNDGIGDVCEDDDGDNILAANDNCPFVYNPDQKDVDNDKTGDSCDDKDNRYIESNSNFFIGLTIIVTLVFFFGIYMMLRKLK